MALIVLLAGLLGLVVGSFLNVVVHRVPKGASVVRPRSACPACGAPVRSRDNVPVVSWLLLRGRCRDCSARISVRYPLVELGTGVLLALTTWQLLGRGLVAAIPAYLYLAAVSVALAAIDLDTRRLPDVIVLPSYLVLGVLLALASAVTGEWSSLLRALAGGGALWLAYFLAAVAKPGGMGFGDVKLAGVIGLTLGWLGWGTLAVGAFAAFLLGGLFAVVLLVAGRAGRASAIPFGPWMLLGAWVGIFSGNALWEAYLGVLV